MIKKLAGSIRQYKLLTFLTPICMILEVVMEVLIPYYMADLVDYGIELGDMAYIRAVGAKLILFALLSLIWFRIFGKERISEDGILTVFFALATQLFMQLGRAVTAFILLRASPGSAPPGTQSFAGALSFCIGFITTDALSGLFTAVILWIARRQDGLFEDQKHYLLRIQEAEKELPV